MKITKDLIQSLNPCQSRYDNYLKFYGDQALTKAQFLGRKNITQADKLWVAFRLMPKDKLRLAAADIAESVLHIFEAEYPNDDRPRKAIAAARAGDKDAARVAAYYVSYCATGVVAYNTTTYADNYVALAANAAAYNAARAAINAADTVAHGATHATYAAINAACAGQSTKLIRKIILKYWRY